jgi:pyruvate formate lyase activating enzyme
MSTEDGPGIRTTVFLKGCTLACKWCHNPESISFIKEHEWYDIKCIRCNTCVSSCSKGALAFSGDRLIIDESKCEKCMVCTVICPTNALEAKGKEWSAEKLCTELIKDSAYFGNGGGVTLSGGEALAQSKFVHDLLMMLKDHGINTAVDTCGQVKFESIERVFDYTDIFLYDLKIMDSELHRKYTGAGSEMILDNYIKLTERLKRNSDTRLWVRTPLIPNVTDTEENIRAIAEFISQNAPQQVERWELLAFNNLCASKYERLNRKWEFRNSKKQTQEKITETNSILSEYKKLEGKAFITGSVNKA